MERRAVVSRGRRLGGRLSWKEATEGRLFALPFALGFLLWWAYPMGYSIYLTVQDWDLITPPKFAGLENFAKLLADPQVALSLSNTAFYTFLGVPIHLVVALALALALNVSLRGVAFYRTVFYLPSITPVVASAVVWTQIFHPEFGMLNAFLGLFGVPPVKWLFEPAIAKPAFIFMTTWTVGPQVVIFLAGLQAVPETLHEAAQIDGATIWQRFRLITLPMLSPIMFFNLVVGIIGSFQVFTSAFVMTAGGPQNATLFTVLYLYRNGFEYFKMGYAAVLAWMLFFIIVFFTIVQFRLASRWVYYEGSKH
ncbi:MAG: sugar ABC transporter permease [Chloroflexi bacterium]|nr:sugar ABC transporter permease [Chloroflexota bacterium]